MLEIESYNVTSQELKQILGANNPIESQEFWDNESEAVFYCDGDSDVCIGRLVRELGKEYLSDYILYYVTDLYRYYLVYQGL